MGKKSPVVFSATLLSEEKYGDFLFFSSSRCHIFVCFLSLSSGRLMYMLTKLECMHVCHVVFFGEECPNVGNM